MSLKTTAMRIKLLEQLGQATSAFLMLQRLILLQHPITQGSSWIIELVQSAMCPPTHGINCPLAIGRRSHLCSRDLEKTGMRPVHICVMQHTVCGRSWEKRLVSSGCSWKLEGNLDAPRAPVPSAPASCNCAMTQHVQWWRVRPQAQERISLREH
mmetsp:Transcript_20815/g.43194  ORF Transcript_20815/g.43194 Transcript_20815/m.43194 type:complete len:155 (-) Transcript_20815:48-512(-)